MDNLGFNIGDLIKTDFGFKVSWEIITNVEVREIVREIKSFFRNIPHNGKYLQFALDSNCPLYSRSFYIGDVYLTEQESDPEYWYNYHKCEKIPYEERFNDIIMGALIKVNDMLCRRWTNTKRPMDGIKMFLFSKGLKKSIKILELRRPQYEKQN